MASSTALALTAREVPGALIDDEEEAEAADAEVAEEAVPDAEDASPLQACRSRTSSGARTA